MTMYKSKRFALALSFCLSGFIAIADDDLPGGPGGPGDDPDPPREVEIPFDGGLSTIIALGAAYAAKRGIDKRKQAQKIGSGDLR